MNHEKAETATLPTETKYELEKWAGGHRKKWLLYALFNTAEDAKRFQASRSSGLKDKTCRIVRVTTTREVVE